MRPKPPLPFLALVLFGPLQGCRSLETDTSLPATATPASEPGATWERVADPSTLGWSTTALEEARRIAQDLGTESLMILDDGRLVAVWGDTADRFYIASIRKSILGVLLGPPILDGRIRTDDTLATLGIDDRDPSLTAAEKRATVRDLMTSSSGVYHRAAASGDVTLPARGSHAPGTFFFYNNWDFNALGTIYNQQTNGDLYQDFARTIARPIGMETFRPERDGRYDLSGVSIHPAYHFDMTARDLLRFALLVARDGVWAGQRLVPAGWIAEITRVHIDAPSEGLSYGYLWWVCAPGSALADLGIPEGSILANGNLNQFIVILPGRRGLILHRGPSHDVSWQDKGRLVAAIVAARPEIVEPR